MNASREDRGSARLPRMPAEIVLVFAVLAADMLGTLAVDANVGGRLDDLIVPFLLFVVLLRTRSPVLDGPLTLRMTVAIPLFASVAELFFNYYHRFGLRPFLFLAAEEIVLDLARVVLYAGAFLLMSARPAQEWMSRPRAGTGLLGFGRAPATHVAPPRESGPEGDDSLEAQIGRTRILAKRALGDLCMVALFTVAASGFLLQQAYANVMKLGASFELGFLSVTVWIGALIMLKRHQRRYAGHRILLRLQLLEAAEKRASDEPAA